MKKVLFFASAIALMATACGPDQGGQTDQPNWDEITEDGFYLSGAATGAEGVTVEWAMAAGLNEVDGTNRDGMYEKYAWLEANKDFELVYHAAGVNTRYSSALEDTIDGNDGNHAEHPTILFKRGKLVIGSEAPAMQVAETGMYHIVLDLNNAGDLAEAQIVLAPAEWGVRGDLNGWGFTAGEMSRAEDGTITYTWTEQTLKAAQKFKFAYGHGWKIQLDDAGKVKANTNLGWTSDSDKTLLQGGADIVASASENGIYKITLTYKNAGYAHGNSFTYSIEKTGDVEVLVPEHMYINGGVFGGEKWDWTAETIVEMTPVNGVDGSFWAVRYLPAGAEFKFSDVKAWDGDNFGLDADGNKVGANCKVEEAGLYLFVINATPTVTTGYVKPATVCGLDAAFGGWEATNAGQVPYTVNADGTASITTTAAGVFRSFAQIEGVDAWRSEFSVLDGKIVYRGNGGEFNADTAMTVEAGKTITLDFNAGTATIQ